MSLCVPLQMLSEKAPILLFLSLYFLLFLFNISGMWKHLYEHVEIHTESNCPPPYFAYQKIKSLKIVTYKYLYINKAKID